MDIEKHIIENALAKIELFEFQRISKYFPSLNSIKDIIDKKEFLKDINIKFEGIKEDLNNLSNKQIFEAVYSLLNKIRDSIQGNLIEYEGSQEFKEEPVYKIFYDKPLKLDKNSERFNGDEEYLKDKEWYVFNANYGTGEEKACVRFIERLINENLGEKYEDIYLIRNELHFKIYDFEDGQAFAPDFVLFLKSKEGRSLTYQIFIEPKGKHIEKKDEWKEKLLIKIKDKFSSKGLAKFIETNKYKVIGVPFYNQLEENKFGEELINSLAN